MTPARDDRSLRRYLLGELPEGEADRFEREYFESDEAFDELVAAEDELIDAHLKGQLTAAEEAAFARHFLTAPERQERVAFARALLAAAGRAPAAPSPLPQATAAIRRVPAWLGWVAALLLGLGSGWLVGRRPAHDDRANLAPAGDSVTVLLESGLQRDAAPRPAVLLPAGASELRLRLAVPDDPYRSYAASVQTAESDPVATRAGLSADRPAGPPVVELRLDARPLRSGEYVVTLTGIGRDGAPETVGDYAFRLKRD